MQYKSKEQVPKELQRKLFLLSVKFEEADGQFQDLKSEIDQYRQAIAEEVEQTGRFDPNLELNLDTFKELLRFFYPNHPQSNNMTNFLFNEIEARGLDLRHLITAAEKMQPYEKELQEKVRSPLVSAALFGYALEIFLPGYWNRERCSVARNKIIAEMKKLVSRKSN